MRKNLRIKFSVFLTLLIIIDQISKYIIRVKGGFYICNRGIAFGLEMSSAIIFLVLVAVVLFVFSNLKTQISISNKAPNPKSKNFAFRNWDFIKNCKLKIKNCRKIHLPLLLIIAGAISNLTDRVLFGCVIDFIDLKFWPVFNLADIYITIGAIAVIIEILRKNKP